MSHNIKIGSKLGKFEIKGPLGSGGAGAVYRVRNIEDGSERALKTLMPGTVEIEEIHKRFIREITVAQKLKHENIVAFDDCGLQEDVLYYTMELVPWGTLGDVLARRRQLRWQDTAECGIHICRALQHLHQNNIVHRDLKPANIFLSDDGRLKVGDFGLARDHQSGRLTIDGQTVGTAKYLSPEQAMAKPDIDGRSDLYAVGCILFEMVAGRPPFVSDDPYGAASYVQLMQQHVEKAPPSLNEFVVGCPPAMSVLVGRLLAKKPAERPQTAAEVETMLAEILLDPQAELRPPSQATAEPAPVPQSLTERLQQASEPERKVNTKALVVLAMIAVLGLALILIFQRSQ